MKTLCAGKKMSTIVDFYNEGEIVMFGKEKDSRFEVVLFEKGFEGLKIYHDKQTGVQYLLAWNGNAAGLTPLLDKDGKPIVDDTVE